MAPPFLKGVVVGTKIGVKIRKAKPFLELIPHTKEYLH
jgi:hypothetical protein